MTAERHDADPLGVTREGSVQVLTLNRPERLNALSNQLLARLSDALDGADADPGVRAVVITGAGRAFCAGADIRGFAPHIATGSDAAVREFLRPGHRVTRRIESMRVPVIAAVNGLAYGGGCEVVEACHLAVAAESARFAKSEIAIGILPTFGGTQRLWRHTGRKRAIELILSGDSFSAAQAHTWGLVNAVVPDGEVLRAAFDLAARITRHPAVAVAAALVAVQRGTDATIEEGLALEEAALREVAGHPDAVEGVTAFLHKRTPAYRS
ncbi:MAG: enoyl-CoA hydratase/isomerase family protein [Actinomycetales bacterium]|nr:enoyl-CoA hydratase/isomerase family protein [Actinomycetales bacterium]